MQTISRTRVPIVIVVLLCSIRGVRAQDVELPAGERSLALLVRFGRRTVSCLVQGCDAVHFEHFDDAVEYETNSDRGNEKTDDAGCRVDPHGTDEFRQSFGVGEAEVGDNHRQTARR